VIWKWDQPRRLLNRRLTNYMKYTNVLAVSPCNPPRFVRQCLAHVNVCLRMSQSMIVHSIGSNDLTGGTKMFCRLGVGDLSTSFIYCFFFIIQFTTIVCTRVTMFALVYTVVRVLVCALVLLRNLSRLELSLPLESSQGCRLKTLVRVMRLGSYCETRLVRLGS